MNTLVWVFALVIFIFVLTYDPKSRTLEMYTPKCSSARYQDLIFGKKDTTTCPGEPITCKGAVIQA